MAPYLGLNLGESLKFFEKAILLRIGRRLRGCSVSDTVYQQEAIPSDLGVVANVGCFFFLSK